MKRLIIFLLIMASVGVFAQTTRKDTIFINLWVINSNSQTHLVSTSKVVEDSVYILPAAQLPSPFDAYQYYYNALAGGKFYLELGSLDSNITLNIAMHMPDHVPFIMGGQRVWFTGYIQVDGYPTDQHYYFGNGKNAVFEFPKTPAFNSMLTTLGYSPNDTLKFAYYNTLTNKYDTLEISTIDSPTKVTCKARHFSQIGAGDGSLSPTSVREEYVNNFPQSFTLNQNYPNPFNPTTIIEYSIPKASNVELKVYNILGNEIATLVSGYKVAGTYKVNFDASRLTSGTYLYKVIFDGKIFTKKMLLVK